MRPGEKRMFNVRSWTKQQHLDHCAALMDELSEDAMDAVEDTLWRYGHPTLDEVKAALAWQRAACDKLKAEALADLQAWLDTDFESL